MVRKATIQDVKAIHQMINHDAYRGKLLSRSLSDLYTHVRDFYVYVNPESGEVQGTGSLYILWDDVAEIRSLVVPQPYRRRGVGRALVEQCIGDARAMGFERVFALTYEVDFFRRFGFRVIERKDIHHKIWADCIHCPKFPDCDEVAMVMNLAAA